MKILLCFVCLAIASCASYPAKIIRFEGFIELRKDAANYCWTEYGVKESSCTIVKKITSGVEHNNCRIIITPEDANENELLLGHEFHHCMTGK
jgi:hypothetical protein